MEVINLSNHPSVLGCYLKEIRSSEIQKDSMRFRRNIERIGELMAVEVSKRLSYETEQVRTPLGVAETEVIADALVLATIMRAGLPFHQGFLQVFDRAENAFLSAYRRMSVHEGKEELEIVSEYLAAPSMDGKTLLLADPMLATGMSMEAGYKAILTHGKPVHTHLCCVLGTSDAVAYLEKCNLPDTTLWCAAIDSELNEHKYIVPGLGDAGDLCFGEKL